MMFGMRVCVSFSGGCLSVIHLFIQSVVRFFCDKYFVIFLIEKEKVIEPGQELG